MIPGYLEFLILLFLPGFALLVLLNQVKGRNVISTVARSYGLSLGLNSVFGFLASTLVNSQIPSPWDAIVRYHFWMLPHVIVAASVLVAVPVGFLRFRSSLRSFALPPISMNGAVAVFLGLCFSALVLSEFAKYPIFPRTYSVDFTQHVQLVRDIAMGGAAGASAILYYGVHYNLALGYMVVGGDPFVQIQVLMALLVLPLSLVVYETLLRIYKKPRLALLGEILFISTGFVWYVPMYNSGLYPNLYSIILSLAFLIEFSNVMEQGGAGRFIPFLVVVIGIYFSHYFAPIFMLSLLLCAMVAAGLRLTSVRKLVVPAVLTLLPLVALFSRPDLLNFALSILGQTGGGGSFTYTTPAADALAFNPFLRYLAAEVFSYGALLLVFAVPLALVYVYRNRKESWLSLVMPIWIVILWALAPGGELAWRFSFQALTPFILLAPAEFFVLAGFLKWMMPERQERRRGGRVRGTGKPSFLFDAAVLIILVLIVSEGSWTYVMGVDLSTNANSYPQAQRDLYSSMQWFAQNTPAGSSIISTTDWRISFLSTIAGRDGQLLMLAPAPEAITYAESHNFGYLLVTYFIPASVPDGFDANAFYASFSNNQTLKMVYQNSNDVIYQIVK